MNLASEYAVDTTVAADFARDGHVLVRGIASGEEIEGCRPVVEKIVREVAQRDDRQGRIDDYSKLFTQVTNIWRVNEDGRRVVFAKRFAGVAARLLGVDSVRLYHDQALFKPPGSAATPWHQDRYYWPLDTDRTVTMWMPLVDVDEEMGPMRFASTSHRVEDLGDISISEATDRRLESLIRERGWRIESQPLRAGDATFHAGGTLHSAGANKTDRVREVLTIIYYAARARVAAPRNDNQRVDMEVFLPGLRPGDEAKSELNPVLYP